MTNRAGLNPAPRFITCRLWTKTWWRWWEKTAFNSRNLEQNQTQCWTVICLDRLGGFYCLKSIYCQFKCNCSVCKGVVTDSPPETVNTVNNIKCEFDWKRQLQFFYRCHDNILIVNVLGNCVSKSEYSAVCFSLIFVISTVVELTLTDVRLSLLRARQVLQVSGCHLLHEWKLSATVKVARMSDGTLIPAFLPVVASRRHQAAASC